MVDAVTSCTVTLRGCDGTVRDSKSKLVFARFSPIVKWYFNGLVPFGPQNKIVSWAQSGIWSGIKCQFKGTSKSKSIQLTLKSNNERLFVSLFQLIFYCFPKSLNRLNAKSYYLNWENVSDSENVEFSIIIRLHGMLLVESSQKFLSKWNSSSPSKYGNRLEFQDGKNTRSLSNNNNHVFLRYGAIVISSDDIEFFMHSRIRKCGALKHKQAPHTTTKRKSGRCWRWIDSWAIHWSRNWKCGDYF